MAKQHRITLMTLGAATAAVFSGQARWILAGTLAVIALGCVLTVVRRVVAIVRELEGCGTKDQ